MVVPFCMVLKLLIFVGVWFVVKLTKRVKEYDKRIHWSNGVGRNKAIQARSARWRFRRIRACLPETPVLAVARTSLFRPTF